MKRSYWSLGCLLLIIAVSLGASAANAQMQPTPPGKLELRGLVDMGYLEFMTRPELIPDNSLPEIYAVPGIFRGTVIQVTWKQLQPKDADHVDFTAIDDGLKAVQTYNAKYPQAPLQVKLRVFAGMNYPAWLNTLVGSPITFMHQFSANAAPRQATLSRFWSLAYRQAWRNLTNALAARYDDNPLISTVAVSSCSTISDESFITPLGPEVQTLMLAAGYTDKQKEDCLVHMLDDYAGWKKSYLELTFNPFFHISSKGAAVRDVDLPLQIMDDCRAKLGSRCVLSLHYLGHETNPEIYAHLKSLGAPVSFQPYSPGILLDDMTVADAAIASAVDDYHASSVEVWPFKTGFSKIPVDHLQEWAAKLNSVPPVPLGAAATLPVK